MATEYISRDAAIDMCDDDGDVIRIRNIPSADVVEVVRCKDCIHADDRDCPIDWPKNEEDYCSFGERRANP